MSAYQELCELYARARARAEERRVRHAAVLEQVGAQIVKRLGVPEAAYGWQPLEGGPAEEGPGCTLPDAMSADEEGVWHVGMQIQLRAGDDPRSVLPLFFDLSAKEQGDHFLVSLSDGDPGHRIHPGDTSELDALAAEAERRLREWLAENLDRVLGAQGRGEQFGLYL